ncbi:hypothetical protein [Streptomyces sp. NPDC056227]|uniref:hypothetical protein n=1 Tax=Streptomyces sp. NPDC056227 TaxID=3345753 RepID=UPI0035DABB10
MNLAPRNSAVAVLLAVIALLLGAPAASAHGGPISLEVTGDGDHGVNVLATWKKDRDPVEETVIGTVTATSTDGRSFGPVKLVSASEGQNLYHAAQPLPTGKWRVTVTAAEPVKAKKTVDVTARDIPAPDPSQAAATDPGGPAGSSLATIVVIGVGIAALAVAGAVAGRRMLRRKPPVIRNQSGPRTGKRAHAKDS